MRYEAYGWHVQRVDSGEDVVAHRGGDRGRPGRDGQAVDHRHPHHHRLAGADQAEHRRGARQRARRRRDPARPRRSSASTPTCTSPSPTRCWRTPARSSIAAAPPTREWQPAFDAWAAGNPERAALLDRLTSRSAARRLGRAPADLPDREGRQAERDLDPRGVRQGALGAGRRAARAVGRLGRPGREQPHDHGRRAELHPGRRTRPRLWPGGPYGRTLHFGIREHAMGSILNGITAARRHPRVRRHVPGLQRLHAPAGAAGRADAAADDLRLDARLDRPGRRRPDPPADRAPGRAAGDPRPRRRAPGRRQRDRGGLAGHPGAHRPPDRLASCPGRTCRCSTRPRPSTPAKGGYVLEEASSGRPRSSSSATGSEVGARAEGARAARGRGHAHPRRLDALPRMVPRPDRVLPAAGAAARHQGPGQRRGRASRRAGARSSATPARSSASSTSAPAPTAHVLFEQFGFTPDRVVRGRPLPRPTAAPTANRPAASHRIPKEYSHERRTGRPLRRRTSRSGSTTSAASGCAPATWPT